MSITKTRKTKTNKESVVEKRHGMATTATIRHELGQSIGVYFDFYNLQESTLLLPGHTQSYFIGPMACYFMDAFI